MNCLSSDQIEGFYTMRGSELVNSLKHLEICEDCRNAAQTAHAAEIEAKFRLHQKATGGGFSRAEFRSFYINELLGDDEKDDG